MSRDRADYGDAAVGQEFDGYRIQEVLGRGGMGIVYKAEDEALSRIVALKMIDPSLARDEAFLRRFRAEARALARIDSSHIVGIYALRRTEIGHFIVMEYVDGGTVSDLLEKGPVPWKQCVPIIRQILKALNDAHSVGVVHRDIKPGNIMMTDGGRVKVADFGLAKMTQLGRESTVTMGISGTLYYMSPEQVKGSNDLDHRSDLYSLGMLTYEMLTGKLPLERGASHFTVMKEIVEKQFEPPRSSAKSLPGELSDIVMKALEKDPANRFQSADEMLEALNGVLADEERTPAAPGPARRSGSETARSKVAIGIAALLIVALGVGGYLVWNLSGAGNATGRDAIISVFSEPEAAQVFIDGTDMGATPIASSTISAGTVQFNVSKPGYASLDTTITLTGGDNPALHFVLRPEAGTPDPSGSLSVRSNPSASAVYLNGERIGTTPIERSDVPAGIVSVEIRREGYQPARQNRVEIREDEPVSLMFDLQPVAEAGPEHVPPEPPAVGALAVSAEPAGPIRVNGEIVQAGTSVTLDAGRQHEVVCGDAPYQSTQRVTIAANETRNVTCYFRHTVNVVVQEIDGDNVLGTWATLTINGETASVMSNQLGPGSYDIGVRRQFYTGISADTTLVIRPSFEPVTHRIAFQIKREQTGS